MAKRFNPGRFRHAVEFVKPPEAGKQDGYGEPLDAWPTFMPAMASKEPILGSEFYNALTAGNKVTVKFRARFIAGVTNAMRIRHGGEVYEIVSAIDVWAAHKELLCYCRLLE